MTTVQSDTLCYIGIGSNMGDKRCMITQAIQRLDEIPGMQVEAVAPFYRTAPIGYAKQAYFINTVVKVSTVFTPRQLLKELQQIENAFGRKRTIRWGPRTLDLDILIYGDLELDEPDLQIPHPRMQERAFVICPLADINPDYLVHGEKAAQLAWRLSTKQEVMRDES